MDNKKTKIGLWVLAGVIAVVVVVGIVVLVVNNLNGKSNKIDMQYTGNILKVEEDKMYVYNEKYAMLALDLFKKIDNTIKTEEGTSVYNDIVKAEATENEIIVYEEYAKEMYNATDKVTTAYATEDNQLKIAEYTDEEKAEENPYKDIVMPQYKHTFKKVENGECELLSSELVNKEELVVIE